MMGEKIVDNFAGGGGASSGMVRALGRPIDIAINHDPRALAMHKANHPEANHLCENVWDVDPRSLVADGVSIGYAWFSPDCKHHSKAKGGKPVEKNIRGLAWVAIRYAATVRPRVIFLENVEEFEDWGPLSGSPENQRPDPDRKGLTFQSWVTQLRNLGYDVDWRRLVAADYGAPTSRRRLFVVARCDGKPIVWPEPTHGKDKIPYRSAAECIDWSIPCPSIFTRKKPLVDNTMRRIAKGLQKFVFDNLDPFIIAIDRGYNNGRFRGNSINKPLSTIVTKNSFGLVTPFITSYYGRDEFRGRQLELPLPTQSTENRFSLVAPYIVKHFTGATGSPVERPFPTIMGRNTQNQLVTAFLARHFGNSVGGSVEDPAPATTGGGGGHTALATSHLIKLRGTTSMGYGSDIRKPMHTISAGGLHIGEVRAFLMKYYGTAVGQSPGKPLDSITSKHRFGLVMVEGEPHQIVDIGMRMLSPRELFNAQGFDKDYVIDLEYNGKPLPKSAQVMMVGNSVSPHPAEALVRANL